MDSRFSWHGCLYCFRVITIVVMFVAILSGYAGAQEVPWVGKPETAPSDSQDSCSGFSFCQLHPSDLKAGIFWGVGRMTVHRDIAPGPTPAALLWGGGGPAIAGFSHRTETDLDDTFGAVEWGFRWGDLLVGTTSFDTNMGRQNQFKQTSTASPGQTSFGGNPTLGVLFLPDDTKGGFVLDNKNRIYNLDQGFAFPSRPLTLWNKKQGNLIPKVQFLAGWQYSQISSDIDPYFAGIPRLTFQTLPGTANWQNFWTDAGVPSSVRLTMDQRFWWTGPYLGARVVVGTPLKLPGQWYVEGKGVPYAWGRYQFEWKGYYNDSPFFVVGQQSTNERLDGYFLAIKGGTQIKLIGKLFLDLWSKYTYLHMSGSGREVQSIQNNFLPVQTLLQEAAQTIAVNEHFWGAGANLVLRF